MTCSIGPKILQLPHKRFDPSENRHPMKASGGFDYPVTLVGKLANGRCAVFYDPALGAKGLQNAKDILAWAPQIIAWHDQTFGFLGGVHNIIIASLNGATDGSDGAYHMGCDFTSGSDLYLDAAFGNSPLVAGLYAAELSECWNISHDWISKTEQTDGDYDSTGAAMVAIDYLISKGFPLSQIAQALCGTLEQCYRELTNQTGFYATLKKAVQALPNGVQDDFPFTGSLPTPPPSPPPPAPPPSPPPPPPPPPSPPPPSPPPPSPPPPSPPPVPVPNPNGPMETFLMVWNGLSAAGWHTSKILRHLPQILKDIIAGESADEILGALLGSSGFVSGHAQMGMIGGWLRRELESHLFRKVVSAGMDPEEAQNAIASGNFGTLIQWVLTHAPQIWAFVAMILALFGVVIPPFPIPVPPPPAVK